MMTAPTLFPAVAPADALRWAIAVAEAEVARQTGLAGVYPAARTRRLWGHSHEEQAARFRGRADVLRSLCDQYESERLEHKTTTAAEIEDFLLTWEASAWVSGGVHDTDEFAKVSAHQLARLLADWLSGRPSTTPQEGT